MPERPAPSAWTGAASASLQLMIRSLMPRSVGITPRSSRIRATSMSWITRRPARRPCAPAPSGRHRGRWASNRTCRGPLVPRAVEVGAGSEPASAGRSHGVLRRAFPGAAGRRSRGGVLAPYGCPTNADQTPRAIASAGGLSPARLPAGAARGRSARSSRARRDRPPGRHDLLRSPGPELRVEARSYSDRDRRSGLDDLDVRQQRPQVVADRGVALRSFARQRSGFQERSAPRRLPRHRRPPPSARSGSPRRRHAPPARDRPARRLRDPRRPARRDDRDSAPRGPATTGRRSVRTISSSSPSDGMPTVNGAPKAIRGFGFAGSPVKTGNPESASAVSHASNVSRCESSGAWDERPAVSRQRWRGSRAPRVRSSFHVW